MAPELVFNESAVALQFAPAVALQLAEQLVALDFAAPAGLTLQLQGFTVEVAAPPALQLTLQSIALSLTAPGPQGPPGPSQVVVGGAQPLPIPGYPIMWFDLVGPGPDDYGLQVIQ